MAKDKDLKLRTPVERLAKKKVAIVGFTDHRVQAFALPRDEWEVWGINELHRVHDVALFDRWFEVHQRKDLDTDAPHIEALGKMDIPVYMQAQYPDIAPSVAFPREELRKLSVEKFGRVYFTSSIAWETALAIYMGAEAIHIYGVDMAQDSEFFRERNCCEAWLGIAAGMGIKVYVPPTSDLLKCIGEYGFGDEGTEFSLKAQERAAWLHQQDNDMLAQIRKMDAEFPQHKAKMEAEYQQKADALRAEFDQNMGALHHEYNSKRGPLFAQQQQITGAILDVNFWLRSWSLNAASDRTFSPDRSKDPRTGIKEDVTPRAAPAAPEDMGINPARAIEEPVAA